MDKPVETAAGYIRSGLSAIPTTSDKRPACAWKTFTERAMTPRETEMFFANAAGIGIVTGRVSGNLELIDFDDGGSQFDAWSAKLPPYIRSRIVIERTPSGGRHAYYRVTENGAVPGNRKLAMKEDGSVLIETRGEGGYVKCAPSNGYELDQGDFTDIPVLSPFEQDILISAAKALDRRGRRDTGYAPSGHVTRTAFPASGNMPTAGVSPWDDFNIRGEIAPLLEARGWKRTGSSGENELWERPGKNERSTSATFNGEVFYVFSSNALPFEPGKGYSRFQVFAALECSGDARSATRRLRGMGYGTEMPATSTAATVGGTASATTVSPCAEETRADAAQDPGPVPEELLSMPGFVNSLIGHTLSTAPYPNRPLAFAGALSMLSHLSGRNFRNPRNLRTNIYMLALADSGVGKDYPRKVNMNLAAELGIMPTMADRFASAEGLEDALLIHPSSFFQVDEVDTLFAALQDKKDSAMEKTYGALLQFATSGDTTYTLRKKAISQPGGKSAKFDKVRARGIREPHLTMLGCAIPKYLYSALSERSLENGLISRCLVLEAGPRGKAGNPHHEPFSPKLLSDAKRLVELGGFDGLDLEDLDAAPPQYAEPFTVTETAAAAKRHAEVTEECEALYGNSRTTSEKTLWSRVAEKVSRLALLHAISENVHEPLITDRAVDWAWKLAEHITRRMLYQASVYVHDNEFDALRQKALRYLRDYGGGSLNHGRLLRYLHIDADTFRRVIDTLLQSELITAESLSRGGFRYSLV